MYNRILVAIDGSKMSNKALKSALQIAKERFSKVGVIHVEKNVMISENMTTDSIDEIYSKINHEVDALFDEAKSLAEDEDLEIETHYVMGDPAVQIVKTAEQGNYQLIVMGSRGLGAIKGIVMGSVSYKVLQLSHCPVLIIK
ncbi:universal stress protein [Bacillus benzoevorans]|uniref:Universal stress protein n=1 Tax=Bacillus benzoevorans TaxID=1456 RepID=A0A7X0HQZ1_9BACI|nr:nucleotide-binding universal stress UspA family protein [Bacillus benzoevorans]